MMMMMMMMDCYYPNGRQRTDLTPRVNIAPFKNPTAY